MEVQDTDDFYKERICLLHDHCIELTSVLGPEFTNCSSYTNENKIVNIIFHFAPISPPKSFTVALYYSQTNGWSYLIRPHPAVLHLYSFNVHSFRCCCRYFVQVLLSASSLTSCLQMLSSSLRSSVTRAVSAPARGVKLRLAESCFSLMP